MDLEEMMLEFSGLPYKQEIANNIVYVELVIDNDDLYDWQSRLEKIFGVPLKPAGVDPDEVIKDITKDYGGVHGGITKDQILYRRDFDTTAVLVMIWPWEREPKATLKMFLRQGPGLDL